MHEHTPEQLVAPLALLTFGGCVAGAGALANCAALAALIRKSRCGLFSILIQLAITDIIILTGPGALELWSRNKATWQFGAVGCKMYGGLDVMTSTAAVYLIITVVLHTIATINVEEKAANRRTKRHCDDEIRSSRHSLMANSDCSTPPRTMNIDYKIMDTTVPVLLPSIFVWILSASLSVPEFALANTIRSGNNSETCVCHEPGHRVNMHSMLSIFNVYLPTVILCAVCAVTVMKLRTKWSLARYDDLGPALKLSLWLIVTYMLLCLPRSLLTNYIIYSTPALDDSADAQAVPTDGVLSKLNLAMTCVYLSASLFRPLFYVLQLPNLRCLFIPRSSKTEDV